MILLDRTRIFMIVMIGADRLIKIMTDHEDHENLRSISKCTISASAPHFLADYL